jgi:hypothetical protein
VHEEISKFDSFLKKNGSKNVSTFLIKSVLVAIIVIDNSNKLFMFVCFFVDFNQFYPNICRFCFLDNGLRSFGWSKYLFYANLFYWEFTRKRGLSCDSLPDSNNTVLRNFFASNLSTESVDFNYVMICI